METDEIQKMFDDFVVEVEQLIGLERGLNWNAPLVKRLIGGIRDAARRLNFCDGCGNEAVKGTILISDSTGWCIEACSECCIYRFDDEARTAYVNSGQYPPGGWEAEWPESGEEW